MQSGHDADSQAPREVVVAGPGSAQGLGPGALAQGPDRLGGGQLGEGLDESADIGARQPEEAVAPTHQSTA